MNPLEAVLLIALLGLPLHLLVMSQIEKLDDPDYLRAEGVVILRPEALDSLCPEIGRYKGCPIWGSVVFMGMRYHFDRVVPRRYRWSLGPRELFLDPGLVYVTS